MTSITHHRMFIDGIPTDADAHYDITHPATERIVATVARADAEHADAAVAAALRAFRDRRWRAVPPSERATVFDRVADLIERRAEHVAALVSEDTGLPIRAAYGLAVATPVAHLRHYARLTRAFEWQRSAAVADAATQTAMIRREPVGVCVGICPWNLPAGISVWKTAPALAAGNSVVLKADEKAPRFALELAEMFAEAGLPAGVLNVVVGDGSIGDHLVRHPDVALISFTGSTATGRRVMAAAAPTVKRVHLELGGKSPSIILDDADLDLAVSGTVFGFALHSGQACESGTRVFVPDSMHDDFLERLAGRLDTVRIGDPADPTTDLGPVMNAAQLARIRDYIESGKSEGARLVCGGTTPADDEFTRGFWLTPTVFTDVSDDMRIAREEIFGPVLAVTAYSSLDAAIASANNTEFGLAAGVWSSDYERALGVADRLDAGTVWINDWHNISEHLPFGGVKQSGVGRELGPDAIIEFTQDKAIAADMSDDGPHRPFGLTVPQLAPTTH